MSTGPSSPEAGNALVLSPVLDLSRDPRYGRVEKLYSEDPDLVAQLGIAAVQGLQGTGDILDKIMFLRLLSISFTGSPKMEPTQGQ